MKRFFCAAVAALALMAASASADAGCNPRYQRCPPNPGPAMIGGIIGGFVGATMAPQRPQHRPPPAHYAPPMVVYRDAPMIREVRRQDRCIWRRDGVIVRVDQGSCAAEGTWANLPSSPQPRAPIYRYRQY